MFKSSIGSKLGSLQFLFFMGAGLLHLCGVHVSWFWILSPLWILLGIGLLFWVLARAVYKAMT
jgi:hypothetical protein